MSVQVIVQTIDTLVIEVDQGTPGIGVPAGGTAGQVLAKINGTDYATQWVNPGAGSGTVTSVALALPAILFGLTGSPITTAGTITATLASQAANKVFASPNGSAGTPTWRSLVAADFPTSGVTAGSYTNSNITVDAFGRITSASNGSGGGGVTSVAVTAPAVLFSSTGSPITSSGTIAFTLTTETANKFFASPSGGSGTATYRNIVAADLPSSGVTPGTFTHATVTVDAFGRITSASSGTVTNGTVTSVAVTAPAVLFSSTGSPITSSGTIAFTLTTETANKFFASPSSGPGTATYRTMVATDLPQSGVTPNTYVNATVTVDIYGRITAASSGGTSGVTFVNGLTGSLTLATGTSGTDFNITNPPGTTITLNIPDASNIARGLVTTGTQTFSGTKTFLGDVILNGPPTTTSQAATKGYVDSVVNGLAWKALVSASTTAPLPANTYANGASGVGATITANANAAFPAQDGVASVLNQDYLVQFESTGSHNGVYTLTALGSGGAPWVLTRRTDADTSAELLKATVPVNSGSLYGGKAFVQTATSITVGTTAIVFTPAFNTIYLADGTTITLTGNTFSLTLNGVSNAYLAQMPAFTVKGNANGSTSNAQDLSTSDMEALLGYVIDVGSIDSQTPSPNGAVVLGNLIYFQSADAANPGLLNTSSQQIGGQKEFTDLIDADGGIFLFTSVQNDSGAITFSNNAGHVLLNPPTAGNTKLAAQQYKLEIVDENATQIFLSWAGVTSASLLTFNFPNAGGEFTTDTVIQTLTNKTLVLTTNTIRSTSDDCVAVFEASTGILRDSAISITQLGTLANVVSDIQAQFTGKLSTTLANGKIYIGSAGNTAQQWTMGGDAALSNSGTLTLATVNSNVGSFTNANITVDAKGRITAAANGTGGSGTPGGISGNFQYNDGGTTFGGIAELNYDNTTGAVTQSGSSDIVQWTLNGFSGQTENILEVYDEPATNLLASLSPFGDFKSLGKLNGSNIVFISFADNPTHAGWWYLDNATYDPNAQEFNRIDIAITAYALNIRAESNIPGESNTGVCLWRCLAGANPISNTYATVGGWENMWISTEFRDFVVGGFGIEIDGDGTLPYGRFANSPISGTNFTGILSNIFLDYSGVDDNAFASWRAGIKGDGFTIERAPSGGSTTFTSMLALTNAGALTIPGAISATNISGTNTGDVTIGAFGSSPDAKGITISGQVITLQPADATHPGAVTTGAQTFAGTKTFSSTIVGSVSGNAGTATALATPRNINGVAFDGTGNITVTAAAGTLTGTVLNSTVTDASIAKLVQLTTNGFLKTSSSNGTLIVDTSTYITGNQTITLSGDASGSGTTAITVTLATVNSNVGSFGSSTSIPTFTVNAKGLITAASGNAVVAPAGTLSGTVLNSTVTDASIAKLVQLTTNGFLKTSSSNGTLTVDTNTYITGNQTITLSGDASGSGATAITVTLATVNSNVGSFGSSTSIPTFTVNAKGLITAASGNAVIAPAGTLSGTTLNATVVSSSLTSVGTIATGVWQGTKVNLAYGGTNADLSATGGAGQFLKQNSTGATITVAQVAETELTFTDNTTNNVSASAHGFAPKFPNDATKFLNGAGLYTTPLTLGQATAPMMGVI